MRIKIITSIMLIMMLMTMIITMPQKTYAVNGGYDVNQITNADNSFTQKASKIFGMGFYVAMKVAQYVSVGALLLIGIKYFMSTVEEKSTLKKSLLKYVIGFIVAFAASSIATIIYNILN